MMTVCGKMKHHGTESLRYMYARNRKYRDGKWKGGGKVHDNREPGTAEIIMVLAALIVLILICRKQLVELAAWFYRSLYR